MNTMMHRVSTALLLAFSALALVLLALPLVGNAATCYTSNSSSPTGWDSKTCSGASPYYINGTPSAGAPPVKIPLGTAINALVTNKPPTGYCNIGEGYDPKLNLCITDLALRIGHAPTIQGGGNVVSQKTNTSVPKSTSSTKTPTCTGGQAPGGSQTYSTPGTHSFVVPAYSTLTVEVWGAGGGGSGAHTGDTAGGSSRFSSITAGGGGKGSDEPSGGVASGGGTNTNGESGSYQKGGASPNGGAGGPAGKYGNSTGKAPGGGGGPLGEGVGQGGGGGAYSKKTYSSGQLSVGSSVTVVVGSGGKGDNASSNGSYMGGGNGANGKVSITWTVAQSGSGCNPVSENENSCTGGRIQVGRECVCPSGQVWNGSRCVSTTPVCQATAGPAPTGSSGSQTFSDPGSYDFMIPDYTGTLKMEVWGGGGGGGLDIHWSKFGFDDEYDGLAPSGGNSSIMTSKALILANGGGGGSCGKVGIGGTASGGSINLKGGNGVNNSGGVGANGGAGGLIHLDGSDPGGGGGGGAYPTDIDAGPGTSRCLFGGGGGGGAFSSIAYQSGDLMPGSKAQITVGEAGMYAAFFAYEDTPNKKAYLATAYVTYTKKDTPYKVRPMQLGIGGFGGNGAVKVTWTSSGQTASLCSAGYTMQGGQCVSTATCTVCPTGQTLNAQNQCVKDTTCPSGFHFDTATNKCVINPPAVCAAGYHLDTATNQCVPDTIVCPAGFVLQGGQCIAVPACPAGQHRVGTQCVADTCVTSYSCSGNNVINNCTGAVIDACLAPSICSSGSCTVPAPNVITWQVSPILVKQGKTTNVSWNVEHVSSCTVTGTNGDSWTGLTGTKVSGAIPSQTIFTLNCTALAGSGAPNVSRSTTVNIIPTFNEK